MSRVPALSAPPRRAGVLIALLGSLSAAVAPLATDHAGFRLSGDGPRAVCERLGRAVVPGRLAHTRPTAATDVASWPLAEDPRAAAEAREHVRHQRAVWGLGDLEATTELVVSELVGNAVRHAKGPLRLRLLRSRSLICEVYDGSLTTPRIRRAAYMDEGGRGLYLVAALCRRWGARYLEEGKCLWAEQELEPAGRERD
ncbi:hypothetical protein ADK57_38550 [Streptomyces sp. MMG1533]|nr:hypothetical protein ADK57_38550 [Streptomyces sp. MMG1533]